MTNHKSLRRKAESGFGVTIQGIFYLFLLFIALGLVFDFGNVGYVSSVATNSARVAAQDAAKNIDRIAFSNNQRVILGAGAKGRAQSVVDGMAGRLVTINSIAVTRQNKHDVIIVSGTAHARMAILDFLLGFGTLDFPVQAYAAPEFGVLKEGQ